MCRAQIAQDFLFFIKILFLCEALTRQQHQSRLAHRFDTNSSESVRFDSLPDVITS